MGTRTNSAHYPARLALLVGRAGSSSMEVVNMAVTSFQSAKHLQAHWDNLHPNSRATITYFKRAHWDGWGHSRHYCERGWYAVPQFPGVDIYLGPNRFEAAQMIDVLAHTGIATP